MNELLKFIDDLTIQQQDSYLAYSETQPHNACSFRENGMARSEIKPRVYVRAIGNFKHEITGEAAFRYRKYFGYMAGEIYSMRICLCDKPNLIVGKNTISNDNTITSTIQHKMKRGNTAVVQSRIVGQGRVRP